MGAFDEACKLTYLSNEEKEVAFLAMHHIGKKAFYEDVATKVDSLQKAGFFVFYEGYSDESPEDSLANDRNERKLRKVLGVALEAYLDTVNHTVLGIKIRKKNARALVNQPGLTALGIDTLTSRRVDISPAKMMEVFEQKHGEVILDSCDLKTSLSSLTYNCQDLGSKLQDAFFEEIVFKLRDQHLAGEIQQHSGAKIAVVYGSMHLRGLRVELGKLDERWAYLTEKN